MDDQRTHSDNSWRAGGPVIERMRTIIFRAEKETEEGALIDNSNHKSSRVGVIHTFQITCLFSICIQRSEVFSVIMSCFHF